MPTGNTSSVYRRQAAQKPLFRLNHIKNILPKNGEKKKIAKKIRSTNILYSNCLLCKKGSHLKKAEPAKILPYIGMEKSYNLSTPMASAPKTRLRNNKLSRSAMNLTVL